MHVVTWFALWQLKEHTSWAALEAVLLLMIPIFLNAISYQSVPEAGDVNEFDMRCGSGNCAGTFHANHGVVLTANSH
ncbi:hypothetical protein J2X06_000387 [Lysobacter niastensis]|uniref:Uncharacterized protein n=1 Tax=Lysobacter niastensis TaxID=380629 RepID=A0ABU1W6H7_9GAMM|nr:hypothetical protein [Lysobacter niastensis]MDR7133203.1 hypothetical protein [Lysobacter niastensis]